MVNMEVAKKIITESGNSFHCKVTNYLKEEGWETLVSPYYTDGITDKPREIDLIAERLFPIYEPLSGKVNATINVKLFIECKFIIQDVVFWFSNIDNYKATEWIMSNTDFTGRSYAKDHHYLSSGDRIAKLFASETKRSAENEPIYKALNQCLNGLVYNRRSGSIIPNSKSINSGDSYYLEYPIIICNSFDRFYKTDMETNEDPDKLSDNFMLEVNYAYLDLDKERRNEYFLIDFISFECISAYLDVIAEDVTKLKRIVEN